MEQVLKTVKRQSLQQKLVLVFGTTLAFALDYLFNVAAGRILAPAEFGILTALAGAGQVMVVGSRVVQTVVTRYVSSFYADERRLERTISFFQRVFRSSLAWGIVGTLLLTVLSFPFAGFLQIDNPASVLALAATTLLIAVRPVVGGVLQGTQRFAALGVVQIIQALLRLAVGIPLMLAGWGAFGAMGALPIASLGALAFGIYVLGRQFLRRQSEVHHDVSFPTLFRFSSFAAAGLIGYALLANLDAVLAKVFFDPVSAGNYGAAVTLGKVVQFFPLAIIMIFFPKATRRRAEERDLGGILLLAMLVVGGICGGIAVLYYLFPDFIVGITLGPEYEVSGLLLGLIGSAMALLSLSQVWLHYFLSTDGSVFVYLIWVGIVIQIVLMSLFHGEMWHLPAIAASNGLWLTGAGLLLYLRERRA